MILALELVTCQIHAQSPGADDSQAPEASTPNPEAASAGAPVGHGVPQGRKPQPAEPNGLLLRAGIALREFSLTGVLSADMRGHSHTLPGALVGTRGVGDLELNRFSIRHRDALAIGYARGGVEGEMAVDFALGTRFPLASHQGPVVRGGLRARLFGNDALYESLLELPQAQLGYQLLQGPLQLELAARAGLVLDGRMFLSSLRQNLTFEPELGGYITLRYNFVRSELEWSWIHVAGSFANAQRGEMRICTAFVPFSACIFATHYFGKTAVNGGQSARWLHTGISLSFVGEVTR